MVSKLARESVLKNKIAVLNGYGYVIIDSPPTLGFLTLNALVGMTADQLGHRMKRRYLLTRYDARTNLSKDAAQKVQEHFKAEVFQTIIPQNIGLAKAPSYGKPVYLLAPDSPVALAHAQLAEEMINHG